jgi:hypothetical protein
MRMSQRFLQGARQLGVLCGVLFCTMLLSGAQAANVNLKPSGTPPGSTVAGTAVTYTFLTSTGGSPRGTINSGATVTITFPAGTDASNVDTTTAEFNGQLITPANFLISNKATIVSFKTPVGVLKKKPISIFLPNIVNPSTVGTFSATAVIANSSGGTDTCKWTYTIKVGVPFKLGFVVQPVNTANGASILPAVQVAVQDAAGNTVGTANHSITLAIGNNAGPGGVLSSSPPIGPPISVTAVNGIATFNVSINLPGNGYTLVATDNTQPTVAFATSNPFNIFFSNLAHLLFLQQPVNAVAGATIGGTGLGATPPTVRVLDSNNQLVNTKIFITVAIENNLGLGATLSGTTTVEASGGIATFTDLSIDKAGNGYILSATSAGPFGTSSSGFNITAGAPAKWGFFIQPTDTVAGAIIDDPATTPPGMQVAVEDTFGNPVAVPAGSESVTLTISSGSGTFVTGSTVTKTVAATGIATFDNVGIKEAGAAYVLTASSTTGFPARIPGVSTAFAITPGVATKLFFAQEPSNTKQFASIFPAVRVTEVDAFGNVDPDGVDDIVLSITSPAGGATLFGTTTVTALNGIASFGDLSIDQTGTYTLTATNSSDGTFATKGSASFSITTNTGNHLVFLYPPSDSVAGTAMVPAVQVAIVDNGGNIQTATNTIVLSFGLNPGGIGAAISTTSVPAVAGIATFDALSINVAASGYTLVAKDSLNALPPTTSPQFTINPGALDHFQISTIGAQTAGKAFSFTITAKDQLNNTVTSYVGPATIKSSTVSLSPEPLTSDAFSFGVVSGSSGVVLQSATLTFASAPGTTTLTVSDPFITSATATSNPFLVSPGPLNNFLVEAAGGGTIATQTAGVAFPIRLTARDANNNTVTSFQGDVQITASNATLGAGSTGGIVKATFPNGNNGTFGPQAVTVNSAQSGTILNASALGQLGVSAPFIVNPDVPKKLAFTVQPSLSVPVFGSIFPTVQVGIQDTFGNAVSGATNAISMRIGNNPSGAILSGVTAVAPTNGVSIFSNLSLNLVGTGYTLVAFDANGVLTSATSNAFDVNASNQNHLVFGVQPANTTAAASINNFTVEIRNSANKLQTNINGTNITVAIGLPNTGGGTLTPPANATVATAGGVATFTGLSINKTGVYTLAATGTNLAPASSSAFSITPGALAKFQVDAGPSGGPIPTPQMAGTPFNIRIIAQDAGGNTFTSFTGPVRLTESGDGSFMPLVGGFVGGVLQSQAVTLTKTSLASTITATDPVSTLSGTSASTFDVNPGPLTSFKIENAVGGAIPDQVAGTPFPIRITAQDAFLNTVTSFTGVNVKIQLASSAVLEGSPVDFGPFSAGVFSTGSINILSAQPITQIAAFVQGYVGLSNKFAVTPGTPTKLVFLVQPSNTQAGAAISPPVVVAIQDDNNNTVTSNTDMITMSIPALTAPLNPSTTFVSGATVSAQAVAGVATFGGASVLQIDPTQGLYSIKATDGSLGFNVTSHTFNITPATANNLTIATQPPPTVQSGTAFALQVQITNEAGVSLNIGGTPVTMKIISGPSGATLGGVVNVNTDGTGLADFTNLTLNKVGAYTLFATSPGLNPSTTTNTILVTPGTTTQFSIATITGPFTAGQSFPVTINALDSVGNLDTNFVGTVDITSSTGIFMAGGGQTGAFTAGQLTTNVTFQNTGNFTIKATLHLGVPFGTSNAFDIVAGNLAQFGISNIGAQVAGTSFQIATITAQDALGNTVKSFSGASATVQIASPNSTLSGGTVTSGPFSIGVLNNQGVTVNSAQTITTLTFTGGGASSNSNDFVVSPGAAAKFLVEAAGGGAIPTQVAGVPFNIQITALDAKNNPTSFAGTAQLTSTGSLAGSPVASGTFTGGVPAVATVNGITINSTGGGVVLTATGLGGFSSIIGDSLPFQVNAGALNNFLVENTGGGNIPPQSANQAFNIRITARDANNNTISDFSDIINVTASAGTLSGAISPTMTGGVIASQSVTFTSGGVAPTLTAANVTPALKTGVSNKFSVSGPLAAFKVGAANSLTLDPTLLTASVGTISTQQATVPFNIELVAVDANNYVVASFAGTAGLTSTGVLGSSATSGAFTRGVLAAQSVTITSLQAAVTITATNGASLGTSAPFAVNSGPATSMLFVPIGNAPAGSPITPAVQVKFFDGGGNLASSATNSVTVAIETNPASGTLSGTKTISAVNGIASFADLSIDRTGNGYTLSAISSGLATVSSPAFNILLSSAPVALSPLTASVTSGVVGEPITFTFAASSTLPLTYTYIWGDGSPNGSTTSGSIVHTYNAPGTFTIIVTATDPNGVSTSNQLSLPVTAAANPGPTPPGGLCTGFTPGAMAKLKATARLKFPSGASKDTLTVSAVILLPDGFSPNGKVLQWNIGGIAQQATLGPKGSSPNLTPTKASIRFKPPKKGTTFKSSTGTLTITMKNTNLATMQLDGVPTLFVASPKTGSPAKMSMCVLFDNTNAFTATATGLYKGTKRTNKAGVSTGTGAFSGR